MQHISIDPRKKHAPTRDMLDPTFSTQLPPAKEIKVHPSNAGEENASLFFVGTATTIMYVERNLKKKPVAEANRYSEWAGIRLMTDVSSL
jgi:hypothetical protein